MNFWPGKGAGNGKEALRSGRSVAAMKTQKPKTNWTTNPTRQFAASAFPKRKGLVCRRRSAQTPTMNQEEILRLLRQHKQQLMATYRLARLELFGSCARGDQTPASDVDILVEYETPPGLFDFVRLKAALAGLLGVEVDLVMKDALRPRIGRRVLREAIPV
jgi:predicted nucleotidyltransferase